MSSSLKGYYGEQKIKSILLGLKPHGVRFLEDVSLPTCNNGVTQIDFIVFSNSLIACLEVKAWYGNIYVPDKGEHWKVTYNKQIVTPPDPVAQNDVHCRAATNASPNGIRYTNLLVFPTNPVIYNKKYYTCTTTDLITMLTDYHKKYSNEIIKQEFEALSNVSNEHYQSLMEKELDRILSSHGTTNLFDD